VVVAPIEDGYVDRCVSERTGGVQPAKPGTENDDVGHVSTISSGVLTEDGRQGTTLATAECMTTNRLVRWGGARLSRRLAKSMPWIGGAIAVATVIGAMKRKGVIGGAFDTALNAIPLIGAAKNTVEFARGRDFFPDRQRPSNIQPAQ
jgi:hypothetical protein